MNFGIDNLKSLATQAGKFADRALIGAGKSIEHAQSPEGKQEMTDAINRAASEVGKVVAAVDEKIKAPETQEKITTLKETAKAGVNSLANKLAAATGEPTKTKE